jgi:hypothetical protein
VRQPSRRRQWQRRGRRFLQISAFAEVSVRGAAECFGSEVHPGESLWQSHSGPSPVTSLGPSPRPVTPRSAAEVFRLPGSILVLAEPLWQAIAAHPPVISLMQ